MLLLLNEQNFDPSQCPQAKKEQSQNPPAPCSTCAFAQVQHCAHRPALNPTVRALPVSDTE
jgi:hypothetical protein